MQTDPNYWIINTDRKSGKDFSYEKRMYNLKVAAVTPSHRPVKIQGFKDIKPGDGIFLYASEKHEGRGIIVCGIAQESRRVNNVNSEEYWDISLGDSWHKVVKPIPFEQLELTSFYGEIGPQIHGSVLLLKNTAAARRLFSIAENR